MTKPEVRISGRRPAGVPWPFVIRAGFALLADPLPAPVRWHSRRHGL